MTAPTVAERVHGFAPMRRRANASRRLMSGLARLDVAGAHRVPSSGPVVLAANHAAFLDGILLFGVAPRPVSFVVKSEAFVPVLTQLVLVPAGQLPVVRGRVDPAPVRTSLRVLDAGGVIGMFPEGTRGDGSVRTTKPGAGYLAVKTGAVVVPVACHGTSAVLHRRTLRRPAVRVVFGEPFAVERRTGRLNRRVWLEAADRIQTALAGLVARTAG